MKSVHSPIALVRWPVALIVLFVPVFFANARFIRPDLVKIPVSRLADNLEKMVQQKPKDVNLQFNLARVHAMAYAQKTDSVQVWRNKENRGAWFGFTPKAVPFKTAKSKTAEQKKEAEKHLQKALKLYEQVYKKQPNHLAARLGHAWLKEKSGKKMEAVHEYREIIKLAWKKEGKLKSGRLGGNYVTVETAGYLIPLLDKKENAQEIQTLQQRAKQLKRLPRPVTPVVIPLRDGLTPEKIVDSTARVKFDADGSGLQKSWTWIGKDAGWLVYDRQGKGKITSALQMFGNVTFWLFWDNGYEAMRTLDDNGDGYLSGPELKGLAIWRDINGNGISEVGEVRPVRDWGIVKLSCRFESNASRDCAAFSPTGVWFEDGSVRPTYDVILRSK